MATAQFAQMGSTPNMLKSDLDMDSLFDFNQSTSYIEQPSASRSSVRPVPSNQTNTNSYDDIEERQTFAGPSHEYDRFKQQTGIPVSNLSQLNQPMPNFNGFDSGIEQMGYGGMTGGWSSGIDMDADMNMDFGSTMPAMFYPSHEGSGSQAQDFVDPTSIDGADEPQSHVGRLWPGMHSQQAQEAAMSRARSQQQQQQQLRMQQHQQHMLQAPQQSKAAGKQRAISHQNDPDTEESISRLLNKMRAASNNEHDDDASVQDGFYSGMSRMRKDEEDMDEDERLLASEEGKKLSSKERRQLRNKVSARAFRSRRKEYIGQLEGEVAGKAQECQTLKTENQTLSEENSRYRALIQTLLRHPAFTPFIEDLSKDPAFIASRAQRPVAATPVPSSTNSSQPTEAKPQRDNSHMSAVPKQEAQNVGMAMIPETPTDISMLNFNNGNFQMQPNMAYNFQRSQNPSQSTQHDMQTFALHDLPAGPSPLDLAINVVKKSRQDAMHDFTNYNGMQW